MQSPSTITNISHSEDQAVKMLGGLFWKVSIRKMSVTVPLKQKQGDWCTRGSSSLLVNNTWWSYCPQHGVDSFPTKCCCVLYTLILRTYLFKSRTLVRNTVLTYKAILAQYSQGKKGNQYFPFQYLCFSACIS